MATSVISQQSSSAMTHHFRQELHQQRSDVSEIISSEGDLQDVEADFQSLVNEMVRDGSKRAQKTAKALSHITSSTSVLGKISSPASQNKKLSSPKPSARAGLKIGSHSTSDPAIVVAMPARVVPDGDVTSNVGSEVVVEKQMRVKDRIRKLEQQLSQDGNDSPQPPDVIMPQSKSGSIRNLAEQFEKSDDSAAASRILTPNAKGEELLESKSVKERTSAFTDNFEENVYNRKVADLEFKNVKEVASMFQDPFTPVTIKPPAPFSDSDVPEAVSPVPVLPPAMRKCSSKQSAQQEKPTAELTKSKNYQPLPLKNEADLSDIYQSQDVNKETEYLQTLSQKSSLAETSTEITVQQPIQYSAQVRCEVRSGVSTPEVTEYQEVHQQQVQNKALKTSSSSNTIAQSSSFSEVIVEKDAATSTFTATAPAPLAKTSAKPPRSESIDSSLPKFSLLRSASAGSIGDALRAGMARTKSDKDIPKFTIKKLKSPSTFGAKVWTPGSGSVDEKYEPTKIETSDLPSFKDVPPVWTPTRGGSASPNIGRKEYNRIKFESSTLTRKPSQENISSPRPEESFAWKDKEAEKIKASSFNTSNTLPLVQSPTVTLLQKKREGQIPGQKPDYLRSDEPLYKPGQKLYTIKREYESDDDELGSRKFAVLGPKKFEGVGPTTQDGVPIALKSGVKSEHQGEWYRRMFDSLHKVKDEDYIVIKYKSPKARYGGYMSEPDGYDSDFGSSRYLSLDRRNKKFEIDLADASPKNTKRYVHQPGRIENYVPGFSSLSEKELRDNPEADVKLEIKANDHPVPAIQKHGGGRMPMSNVLRKESGYESDSTLIFRKREDQRRRLDPHSTSVIYRQIQQGGEIPLSGLQKPAPTKPKEPVIGTVPYSPYEKHYGDPSYTDSPYKYNDTEVNIHYRTPIRFEQKEALSEEELARRQEEHMKKVYEQERRKKYLAELEDIERRRHADNFTPLQKSPIPLNRYDDESVGGLMGAKTPEPKQMARALFSFTAQNKRELSFNKGDILTIRRSIDKNWYEGELRGSVGIFPCNYVEVVPFDSLKTLGRKASEGQSRARFNFQAQTAMEMSLVKGEIVILTRRVDENWYEGRVGNRKGIFPVSYVDVLMEPGSDRPLSPSCDPMPRPALPAAHLLYNGTSGIASPFSTLGRSGNQNESRSFTQQLTVNTQQDPIPYRALYNYKPQNDDELELIEGDTVLVMEKCDDGWFVGTSKRTNLFGTFPGNYVEKI